MAYISISLGLINLFPIPMLDGGHLMFYLIEKILGRPLSTKNARRFFSNRFIFTVFPDVFCDF